MLRKMKIGTRVNVLIAVPLLALMAFTAVSYVALQRASVRGSEYRQLKAAQALRSDIVAPPASLLEAWSVVNHIGVLVSSPVSDRTNIEIDDSLKQLVDARTKYEASVAYWRTQALAPATKRTFDSGAQSGAAFFASVDSVLLPAIQKRVPATVISAVRVLGDSFNVEQVFIDQSLGLVQARVAAGEASTDDFVTKVQLVLIAAVGALLLFCLAVAFMVRRSIVGPILALSSQARKVATSDLPDAVHQIQSLPADAPLPNIEPFRLDTNDELADLGASFNSVHNAALNLAAEQAQARRIVSENLVNIARRTQSLLGRSLTSLSDMEQGERDPDMLENLFRLDHLTTRMRRNAQSLLVLAGAEPNRMWSAAVPIGDVVRGAVSEIENYSRVEFGDLGAASVLGALAPDIAHLLAELLENATTFSPPTTRVMVVGRAFVDGHQLAIVDYGIGMAAGEIVEANATLGRRSDFDTASSKMLGFQVVARIAARHGVQVLLAQTAGATGITAIVKIPLSVLDDRNAPAQPPAPEISQTPTLPPPIGQYGVHTPAPGPVATVPTAAPTGEEAAATLTDAELWAMVGTPTGSSLAHATPAAAATSGVPGLAKRVRGAQLPDLGATSNDQSVVDRSAEQVKSSLASLQRGTDLGRQHNND